ncbi:hypothetical protein CsSME_00048176 [Camellia sinensis var. sinensis]
MSSPHWAKGRGLVMELSSSAGSVRHLPSLSASNIPASRLGGPTTAGQNGPHNCPHVFHSKTLRLCLGAHIPNTGQRGIFCKAFLAGPSSSAKLCFAACALLSCLLGAVRKRGMRQWDPSNLVQASKGMYVCVLITCYLVQLMMV